MPTLLTCCYMWMILFSQARLFSYYPLSLRFLAPSLPCHTLEIYTTFWVSLPPGTLMVWFYLNTSMHVRFLIVSQWQTINQPLHRQTCLLCFDGSGPPVADPTLYRSLVGALQYLTFTRPDLTYVVWQVCLHMHDMREQQFTALKCIMRYIRGTTDHGLQISSSPSRDIIAYSNTNWCGCLVTRCSTFGFCVFMGHNLLSCSLLTT